MKRSRTSEAADVPHLISAALVAALAMLLLVAALGPGW